MSLLPLFPLPNVVLFPGALLPLHIFEPRYRAMVADALESDGRIGMVLLRPGWDHDYEGRPAVHAIGCSAAIVHAAQSEDGRYNIVLCGLERFRVLAEDHDRTYRRATITSLPEPAMNDEERQAVHERRLTLEARLGLPLNASGRVDAAEAQQLAALPDAEFVHTVSQHLDLEPIEQQALLERDTLHQRVDALLDLLEMRRLSATLPPRPGVAH
jgi:uncharacterized protein